MPVLLPAFWMIARIMPALVTPSAAVQMERAPLVREAVDARPPAGLSPLSACAREECRFFPSADQLRPSSPQTAKVYWNKLMVKHLPDSVLGSAALWFAQQHVQVDVRPNRFFLVVRVDSP